MIDGWLTLSDNVNNKVGAYGSEITVQTTRAVTINNGSVYYGNVYSNTNGCNLKNMNGFKVRVAAVTTCLADDWCGFRIDQPVTNNGGAVNRPIGLYIPTMETAAGATGIYNACPTNYMAGLDCAKYTSGATPVTVVPVSGCTLVTRSGLLYSVNSTPTIP